MSGLNFNTSSNPPGYLNTPGNPEPSTESSVTDDFSNKENNNTDSNSSVKSTTAKTTENTGSIKEHENDVHLEGLEKKVNAMCDTKIRDDVKGGERPVAEASSPMGKDTADETQKNMELVKELSIVKKNNPGIAFKFKEFKALKENGTLDNFLEVVNKYPGINLSPEKFLELNKENKLEKFLEPFELKKVREDSPDITSKEFSALKKEGALEEFLETKKDYPLMLTEDFLAFKNDKSSNQSLEEYAKINEEYPISYNEFKTMKDDGQLEEFNTLKKDCPHLSPEGFLAGKNDTDSNSSLEEYAQINEKLPISYNDFKALKESGKLDETIKLNKRTNELKLNKEYLGIQGKYPQVSKNDFLAFKNDRNPKKSLEEFNQINEKSMASYQNVLVYYKNDSESENIKDLQESTQNGGKLRISYEDYSKLKKDGKLEKFIESRKDSPLMSVEDFRTQDKAEAKPVSKKKSVYKNSTLEEALPKDEYEKLQKNEKLRLYYDEIRLINKCLNGDTKFPQVDNKEQVTNFLKPNDYLQLWEGGTEDELEEFKKTLHNNLQNFDFSLNSTIYLNEKNEKLKEEFNSINPNEKKLDFETFKTLKRTNELEPFFKCCDTYSEESHNTFSELLEKNWLSDFQKSKKTSTNITMGDFLKAKKNETSKKEQLLNRIDSFVEENIDSEKGLAFIDNITNSVDTISLNQLSSDVIKPKQHFKYGKIEKGKKTTPEKLIKTINQNSDFAKSIIKTLAYCQISEDSNAEEIDRVLKEIVETFNSGTITGKSNNVETKNLIEDLCKKSEENYFNDLNRLADADLLFIKEGAESDLKNELNKAGEDLKMNNKPLKLTKKLEKNYNLSKKKYINKKAPKKFLKENNLSSEDIKLKNRIDSTFKLRSPSSIGEDQLVIKHLG